MDNDREGLARIVADATTRIRAILSGKERNVAGGTLDPAVETMVGEAVDRAVEKAGGDSALFAVTEALAKQVPFGARRLRYLRSACRRERVLDEAALAVAELLAGDPEADGVEIGGWVDAAVRQCVEAGGVAPAALDRLGGKLGVSASKLRRFRDAFLVAKLGGRELAGLFPYGCPTADLCRLVPILKGEGLVPWRKKEMVLKAAGAIARQGLRGNEATALVGRMIEARNEGRTMAVAPAWHRPKPDGRAMGQAA